ncbi:Pentatricopeptide repeat-containing protein [Platanthera guangdongensis]|uniref:Pentatricopeptide repeat-containing protein n=1 Tax=Platanthera guangdongensis TaxID=2320717 RepID=A0ABR2MVQ8_9ASPA
MLLRPALHLALRSRNRALPCLWRSHVLALNLPYTFIETLFTSSSAWTRLASHPLLLIKADVLAGAGLNPVFATWALKLSVDTIIGRQIHSFAICSGVLSFVAVANSLLNFYSKSGLFDSALKLFIEMPEKDTISWNTILCGFSSGHGALRFTQQMRRSGVPLDPVTFTTALSFSGDVEDIDFVRQLHALAFNSGFNCDIFVCNAFITAYSRRSNFYDARVVFDEMPVRDLVSWNALLSGLTQEGSFGAVAIELFVRMLGEGLRPDHISVSSAIAACSQNSDLCLGRQIHCCIAKVGLQVQFSVSNVLMSMYYKHANVDCATNVFLDMNERDAISWTTMISMYSRSAVTLFNSMRMDGVQPNDVTFVALADAISPQHFIEEGEMIHDICFKVGLSTKINVSNTLITMYAKLSNVEGSRKIFDEMEDKVIVTWNSLLSGYVQNGLCEEALGVFSSAIMHCEPNQYTFASVISAITVAQTVYLTFGRRCHCHILKLGLNLNEFVAGALIDMYGKRGSIRESLMAFEETVNRSLISWTAIVSAHAKHGCYEIVMKLFEEMLDSGVWPDHIIFLAVLAACCCRGLVSTGNQIFYMMMMRFKIQPWPEHYACMVDMLGKAGRLLEAEEFLRKIPCGPGVSALHSLLGACRLHGDMDMGKRAAEALMEKVPFESGAYVLMSNIYADAGEWENAARLRRQMRDRGVKKEVAYSWVDVGIADSLYMHKFSSGDKTHPLSEEIYRVAECLSLEMRLLDD